MFPILKCYHYFYWFILQNLLVEELYFSILIKNDILMKMICILKIICGNYFIKAIWMCCSFSKGHPLVLFTYNITNIVLNIVMSCQRCAMSAILQQLQAIQFTKKNKYNNSELIVNCVSAGWFSEQLLWLPSNPVITLAVDSHNRWASYRRTKMKEDLRKKSKTWFPWFTTLLFSSSRPEAHVCTHTHTHTHTRVYITV